MKMTCFRSFLVCTCIIFAYITVQAQEFPVAVGSDTTFSGGAVYGGGNGIVAVQGDNTGPYSINAQLIAYGGTLIGSRISLGSVGMTPGATPIFDGTNYFLVWREFSSNLKGQFINTSGVLVGSSITIATGVSVQRPGSCAIIVADTVFLVVFTKTDDILYGQFVGKSGNLIQGQFQISNNYAREVSLAYDGTNFLVTWVEIIPDTDKDIYGQFVSNSGVMVGSNFLIDGGPNNSDNPTSLAFDGTRYLLVYHEQPHTGGNWTIMGRFIATSGTLQESVTICDSSLSPLIASVAFDNDNYFVTWTQLKDNSMRGRFFNKSGVPVDTSFIVIAPSVNKMAVGGVGFGGGYYLVVGTKVNFGFTDGDVYARFVTPLATGVDHETNLAPGKFALYQNYPNPFNPSTSISFSLQNTSYISLKIYDVLGRERASLVSQELPAGYYTRQWNANDMPSGVYFYRLSTNSYTETKKLVLMK